MLAIGCDKDDSPSGDGGDTPKSAGDTSVIDAINEQFNSCPLRTPLGTTFDNNDYQKCDFPSLGEAGNSIHEFDGTTYFPAPWIQQIEQGHTDANQSGGITNNWTRTSNFPGAPVGKDGVISVFVEDFTKLPSSAFLIQDTTLKDSSGDPLVTLMCSYSSDAGDDGRGGLGCGCYRDAYGTKDKPGPCWEVPDDITPQECSSSQWSACKSACAFCNNWCPTDGTQGGQCAFRPSTKDYNGIKFMMDESVAYCQRWYNAGGGTACYNEILVDVRDWTKKTPVEGRELSLYTALPTYFPQAIWAFGFPKNYYDPPVRVPIDQDVTDHGQLFATRAWANYNFLYPDANTPLIQMDHLIPINTSGDTNPFSVVCDGVTNDSDACKEAMYLAGVADKDGSNMVDFLICDSGRKASVTGTPETGILAQCLCADGQPPNYDNTCP